MLDEPPVLVFAIELNRDAFEALGDASAVATSPAVVGSIATCSAVSAILASARLGFGPARQFRRTRKRTHELGLEPRVARGGE